MSGAAGPCGPLQARFEDGLRFLAAATALAADPRGAAPALTAACDALRCWLEIFQAAARERLPDTGGHVARLKGKCEALLCLSQDPAEALLHALAAARLARDEAARLLVRLQDEGTKGTQLQDSKEPRI